jgi:hypothetical protein
VEGWNILWLSVSVATWSTRNEYNSADKVNDANKTTGFSRYLSIETLVFRDPKLQVHQGGDYSEFDVLGRTMEAEMNELSTKT